MALELGVWLVSCRVKGSCAVVATSASGLLPFHVTDWHLAQGSSCLALWKGRVVALEVCFSALGVK